MAFSHEQTFRLDTDWEGYLKILDVVGERPIKVTYDRGRLELMTLSYGHESMKSILASLLQAYMIDREIDYAAGGGTTFKRQDMDRGLEPDECYWIDNWRAMQGVQEFDPLVHPPPDLAIEVDKSRSSINRISMLATLGVPEVWRYTRQNTLEVRTLTKPGEYSLVTTSRVLPGFEPGRLLPFLAEHPGLSDSGLIRAFRKKLDDF